MMIEVLTRYTEMKLKKTDDQEAFLDKIVNGNSSIPFQTPEFYYDYSATVFDMKDVSRFNKASDAEYTTIRFKDGDIIVIKYPYKEFSELYIQYTGKTILSLLEENSDNEGGDSTSPTLEDDIDDFDL